MKFVKTIAVFLAIATVLAIGGFHLADYGDRREEAGRQAVIQAYQGSIVEWEYPNHAYLRGDKDKRVPDVELRFGLFLEAVVSEKGEILGFDRDEELPVAAITPSQTTPKP